MDHSRPVLTGEGDDDYARYMRTNRLLDLQRRPEEMVHRDELLFQTVHQSTELWLKLGCCDADQAAEHIIAGTLDEATVLMQRAAFVIELVTGQLEMLRFLTPQDFQRIRTVLGNGSGLESPGWREVRRVGGVLRHAVSALLTERDIDTVAVYRGSPHTPTYRLAESLIDWDERVSLWRARHYKIAVRIIGHHVIGTQGTPVDTLTKLIGHKFFPELWQARTTLTETASAADLRLMNLP